MLIVNNSFLSAMLAFFLFLGFFHEENSASENWFKSAADVAGADYLFGYSHNAEVLDKYQHKE